MQPKDAVLGRHQVGHTPLLAELKRPQPCRPAFQNLGERNRVKHSVAKPLVDVVVLILALLEEGEQLRLLGRRIRLELCSDGP